MKKEKLKDVPTPELVRRFVGISVEQGAAIYVHQMRTYNRLYQKLSEITALLRSCGMEARRQLFPLLDHPDAQVRINAAHELLWVDTARARATFEALAESAPGPQKLAAGMALHFLDTGVYKPK